MIIGKKFFISEMPKTGTTTLQSHFNNFSNGKVFFPKSGQYVEHIGGYLTGRGSGHNDLKKALAAQDPSLVDQFFLKVITESDGSSNTLLICNFHH